MHDRSLLHAAADHAAEFLETLPDAPVRAEQEDPAALRAALGGPLPEGPLDARVVLDDLVAGATPGIVRSQSPRYFGFVVGGTLPAAVAADWMASAWDQNAGIYVLSPASAVLQEVIAGWLKELLGLPAHASFGTVTGSQMAHTTCLAAARHHVLAELAWNVEERGLQGAPPLRLFAGAHRHVTIDRAARLLGLGTEAIREVPVDAAGRMEPPALAAALAAGHGPAIVCLQAGDVNAGAFDLFDPLCEIAHAAGAWVHVDGAFGLWAAASPSHRHLVHGVDRADSWVTDAHKWLNVPYDCGLLFVAHPEPHRAAMASDAAYIGARAHERRDEEQWTPEYSRRSRAIAVYAALRALGRSGVAELVDRCCACARRFAELLGEEPGVEVLNGVALNQVLVRFGDSDATTDAVIEAVQRDGTCWLGGTTWRGRRAMRISVSNWATTQEDVERAAAAILRCFASVAAARS
jgi:glutamate/tyrosine decarboxylase-like PLP-dependent enzyme